MFIKLETTELLEVAEIRGDHHPQLLINLRGFGLTSPFSTGRLFNFRVQFYFSLIIFILALFDFSAVYLNYLVNYPSETIMKA